MFDFNNLSAYEESVYQELLNSKLAEVAVITELFQNFYPIIYHIYRGEIDSGEYVSMLIGIYKKRLSLDEVITIVGEGSGMHLKRFKRYLSHLENKARGFRRNIIKIQCKQCLDVISTGEVNEESYCHCYEISLMDDYGYVVVSSAPGNPNDYIEFDEEQFK